MEMLIREKDPTARFFVDEIGFLETIHDGLQQALLQAMQSSLQSILVVRTGEYPFLKKVRAIKGSHLVEVTLQNRDSLAAEYAFHFGQDPIRT